MTTVYNKLVEEQRAFYRSGATTDLEGRRKRVATFKALLVENKKALDDSIFADLHRKDSEVDSAVRRTDEVLQNLEEWAQPKQIEVQPVRDYSPDSDALYIVPEPLGVVLVIGPWNYPLVCILPLVHALAAGNTVIVKPSELVPTFSSVFSKLIDKYYDKKEVAAVEGGVPETTELLKERFDHILYTGCPPVAKIIMTAAAKFLTPVTLECGGKNPVFVDSSADLSIVTKSIMEAKIENCGQICISTDYIITTPDMKQKVIAALSAGFDKVGDLSKFPDYARIVNARHFQRLMALLDKTKGKIVYKAGGEINASDKFIPFHLIDVELDDEFMKEEVFGPLLPLVTLPSFDAALDYIKTNEKPLAAYIFTSNDEQAKRFVRETSSGGITVNDAMAHVGAPGMPFGGVGNSGMGRIHGKFAFDMFTHEKPVCFRANVNPSLKL